MNKLFLFGLLMACANQDKSVTITEDSQTEPKCTYKYFQNDKHELDSTVIFCPDIKPPKPMRIHQLNIDSIKNWNIG